MNDDKIKLELKDLIDEGVKICSNISTFNQTQISSSLSNESRKASIRKWEYRALNLLKLRFGINSDFYKNFSNSIKTKSDTNEYYRENVDLATKTLEFILYSLEHGFTEDLFYKHEMILFGDMLNQAFEFLKLGHKLAAAIYGRIILDLTIIEFADKNGIDTKRKFNEIIIDLRKGGFIHEPFENSLRANYKLGSLAAHGDEKFNEFSITEIREYLSFIRDKVLVLE